VREPEALTAWLDRWENEMRAARLKRETGALSVDISNDCYCSYASVESVQSAIERLRSKNIGKTVSLPRLSAYSFRHKVATVLRKSRLSEDEIGLQLGHRREAARTTAGYGEWDPDYLKGVADALEAWFEQLQTKVKNKVIFAVSKARPRKVRTTRRA
jgi:integrase